MTGRPLCRPVARTVAAAALLTGLTAGPAFAAWAVSGEAATGYANAATLPTGSAPTAVARLGRDLDVTWSQVTFDGKPLSEHNSGGYRIQRNGQAAGHGCAALLIPDEADASCLDEDLAPGTYAYTVRTALGGWGGPASAPATVTVPSPQLSLTGPDWTPGQPMTGVLDAFLSGAALRYRLNDRADGPVLTGSLTTFPQSPTSGPDVSIDLGCGPAGTTTHQVYATSGTEYAAAAFTFDFSSVLCPSSITSTSGANPGQGEPGDTLTITFSRPLDGDSICSGLEPGQTTNGTLLARIENGGSHDTLTLSVPALTEDPDAACGGAVQLGQLDLGSGQYAAGSDVQYSEGTTLALSADGTALVLTLGERTGPAGTAPASAIATYSPPSSLRSATGALDAQGHGSSGGALW